jgi:hypothetical protein
MPQEVRSACAPRKGADIRYGASIRIASAKDTMLQSGNQKSVTVKYSVREKAR